MRKVVLGAVLAGLVGIGSVMAQTTVVVTPEQRTQIKEYVVKHKIAGVTVKEKITVGATVPGDVQLVTVPTEWGPAVQSYRYIYTDNQVYFVDPSTRRVVHVID